MNTTTISNLLCVLKTKNRLGILISFISFVLLTNITTMKLIYANGRLKITDPDDPKLDIICDTNVYADDVLDIVGKSYEVNEVTAFASKELIENSLNHIK